MWLRRVQVDLIMTFAQTDLVSSNVLCSIQLLQHVFFLDVYLGAFFQINDIIEQCTPISSTLLDVWYAKTDHWDQQNIQSKGKKQG